MKERAYIIKQESMKTQKLKATDFDNKDHIVRRLQLHATTGFSISRKSAVTTQPMADNADRADHYRNEAVTIKLDGYIADAGILDAPTDALGNVLDGFDDHLNINTWIGGNRTTSEEYMQDITSIQETKQLVTVILPTIGLFSNCMITEFLPKREVSTGLGLRVTITLQKLLVASVGSTVVVEEGFKDQGAGVDNAGEVTTIEIKPEELNLYETKVELQLKAVGGD